MSNQTDNKDNLYQKIILNKYHTEIDVKKVEKFYFDYCKQLQNKYGLPKYNYWTNNQYKSRNVKNKHPTIKYLQMHHIQEHKFVDLSKSYHSISYNDYELHQPHNLCYCNLIEHLYLHYLIECRNNFLNGGVPYLMQQLLDIYNGKIYTRLWSNERREYFLKNHNPKTTFKLIYEVKKRNALSVYYKIVNQIVEAFVEYIYLCSLINENINKDIVDKMYSLQAIVDIDDIINYIENKKSFNIETLLNKYCKGKYESYQRRFDMQKLCFKWFKDEEYNQKNLTLDLKRDFFTKQKTILKSFNELQVKQQEIESKYKKDIITFIKTMKGLIWKMNMI